MSDRVRVLLMVLVAIGTVVAVKMIHRKKLNLAYSLLWIAMALGMVVAVVFPETVYALAALVGIELPLNMILIAFALFSLVMMFYLTCIVSRENDRSRTMTQQLALLEKRVRELEEKAGESKWSR